MRRWAWVLLLPVVWVPLIGLVVLASSALPWYAILVGALFWVGLWRRRRAGLSALAGPGDSGSGLAWSPTHRSGGGLW